MPVYEYRCVECGKDFEVRQKFSDDPVSECKFCSGKVEKLMSLSSFSLKGSGWFKDGYSTPEPSCASKPEAAPSKGEGCGGCPAAGGKDS